MTKRTPLLTFSLFSPLLLALLLLVAFMHSAHAAPNATLTVSNLNDSGAGSLRQAIVDATDGDTIDFSASGTIILASELLVDKSVTISGTVPITISGNNATRVFHVTAGHVTLDSLTIINGYTIIRSGGGIRTESGTVVTVSNSTLSGNSANRGGGIYTDFGTVTVSNSTLSGNSAHGGGGIYNNGGTVTVSNSTLSGNSAPPDGLTSFGGGIYNVGTVTVSNSTLSGNSAYDGGGIANDAGTATVSNSTLSGNSAISGGGIYISYGTVTVSNSTFSGNSASVYGGGIYNGGTVTVSNSTLSGNSAIVGGGGIFTDLGTATVSNSIIANSLSGDDCTASVAITSTGYNLDSDGSCGLNMTGDITNTNPNLGPLADNGGPATGSGQATLTHTLLAGSPAIDAGNCSSGPAIDQRGVARPQDNSCDIGAFESPSTLTMNVIGSGSVTQNPAQADYAYGDVVAITAVSNLGWTFASWGGDLSGSTNPTHINIDTHKIVTATFSNDAPTADAGSNQSVDIGQLTTLDGSGSVDADPTQTLSYGWDQTGGPMVNLSDATAVSPTFTAPDSQAVLTFTLTVTDNLGLPSLPSVVVVRVEPYVTFLPLVVNQYVSAPDLTVNDVSVSSDNVTVVIENQGNAPVVDPFWVDVYLNPNPVPTAVNQTWQLLGTGGLVWGVEAANLPLLPGQTLTLTIGDAAYRPEASYFSGTIATGTAVYAQVDSASASQ